MSGDTLDEAQHRMEAKAKALCKYSSSHFLSVNPAKTQIMWAGKGKGCSLNVNISGTNVDPIKSVEVLGISFNDLLRPVPFQTAQLSAAKRIRGTIRRLALHLPRGLLLKDVARALIAGKLGYGASVTFTPRFSAGDHQEPMAKDIQIAINDTARAVLQKRRSARISRETLLQRSGIPSLNHLTISNLAIETWRAVNRTNGPHDPLGNLVGTPGVFPRQTRAGTNNLLSAPLSKPFKTFVWEAHKVWNSAPTLCEASSLAAAKAVAHRLAANAPL